MSGRLVGMIILHVEAGALELEVGISRDEWIISYLHFVRCRLIDKQFHGRRIVGCIVLTEIDQVGSQFAMQHVCYHEIYI